MEKLISRIKLSQRKLGSPLNNITLLFTWEAHLCRATVELKLLELLQGFQYVSYHCKSPGNIISRYIQSLYIIHYNIHSIEFFLVSGLSEYLEYPSQVIGSFLIPKIDRVGVLRIFLMLHQFDSNTPTIFISRFL